MTDFAASFGITKLISPEMLPNTHQIMALAEYARDLDKLDVFRSLAMKARWEEDRDLEDEEVLKTLAKASGLNPAEALAACKSKQYLSRVDSIGIEAQRIDITGIPAFIIGSQLVVGCQPYDILAKAVVKAGGLLRTPAKH
jgi:predicted DsbA family dithiol-disulfide isomerase